MLPPVSRSGSFLDPSRRPLTSPVSALPQTPFLPSPLPSLPPTQEKITPTRLTLPTYPKTRKQAQKEPTHPNIPLTRKQIPRLRTPRRMTPTVSACAAAETRTGRARAGSASSFPARFGATVSASLVFAEFGLGECSKVWRGLGWASLGMLAGERGVNLEGRHGWAGVVGIERWKGEPGLGGVLAGWDQ